MILEMIKMNFSKLSLRMFKSNIKRYALYFLCSGFITMVLFLYLTIYTNKDFNDPYKVDSFISSNLIAPTLVLCIFSACFIIYAHNYFIKFRKKDFGLFMIIGMTENDIRKIIILENILISITSILTGIAIGTCFSKIFYFIISEIINIKIDFSVNIKSYLYTIIFLGSVNLIMIFKSCIFVPINQIINLLKAERREEKNLFGKPLLGILGIILISSQCIWMFNKRLPISFSAIIIINILAVYLVISNIHWFCLKIFKANFFRNVIWINNLRHTIGSSKKIIFSITLLITVVVYFISFSYTANESFNQNVIIKNPYDLAYGELFNKNKISEENLKNILNSSDTKVKSINNLEIIYQRPIVIISSKSLNNLTGNNFSVEKGKYICLLQINRNDGYIHKEQELKAYSINNVTYTSQEKIENILFNNLKVLNGSYYLIFNDEDYKEIKNSINSTLIGNIKLINFDDWSKSENVINNLTNELGNYNRLNTEQFFSNKNYDDMEFKPVSKIADYMLSKESNQLLIFLLCFVFILFFISSNLMIHFKLLTEFEQEKIKYEKLNKIGFSEKDISLNISKELSIIFLIPCIAGMCMGTYFIYLKILSIGIGKFNEINYALGTGTTYMILELIFYAFYKKYYIKKILR